jgi:hypothetical protein
VKRYQEALKKYVATGLGDAVELNSNGKDDALLKNLRDVMNDDTKYFNICVGSVLSLFIGAFVLISFSLKAPERIPVIFGATGISIAPLIKQMIGLWREKSHAQAAYILATKLPAQELKSIVRILLQGNK